MKTHCRARAKEFGRIRTKRQHVTKRVCSEFGKIRFRVLTAATVMSLVYLPEETWSMRYGTCVRLFKDHLVMYPLSLYPSIYPSID